jgi:hypothetical protein
MRILIPIALAAMIAGAAGAQPVSGNPPAKTTQCIDPGGLLIPPVCQTPASRLDSREYICTCQNGGMRTEVAVCAKGQTPPPEGKALNIARRDAARDGSLIGDTFEGKPICVAPRGP